jgi:hypothetical protein
MDGCGLEPADAGAIGGSSAVKRLTAVNGTQIRSWILTAMLTAGKLGDPTHLVKRDGL